MLSMLRLLSIVALLNISIFASQVSDDVVDFLQKKFDANSKIENVSIQVEDQVELKNVKGWYAIVLNVKAVVTKNKQHIAQKMVWFSDGNVISPDLMDLDIGESLKDSIHVKMKSKFYKKEFLISGDENSKHKVAIFSDPVCPFCKRYVPGALKYMKAHPKQFAVYFYHLPLTKIHPAASTLVKASIYAELQGKKDVVAKLYGLKADYRASVLKKLKQESLKGLSKKLLDKEVVKIYQQEALKEFNKAFKMKITKKELNSPEVLKIYKEANKIANDMMVRGTPTVFFDDQIDGTKTKYKRVK